jgi:hypothetical protein
MNERGMIIELGNRRPRRENNLSAMLSTTNRSWTALGLNLGPQSEKCVCGYCHFKMSRYKDAVCMSSSPLKHTFCHRCFCVPDSP